MLGPLQSDSGAAPAPFLRSFQQQVCLFMYLLCPTGRERSVLPLASKRMDCTNSTLRRGGGDQEKENQSLGSVSLGKISDFSHLYETLGNSDVAFKKT